DFLGSVYDAGAVAYSKNGRTGAINAPAPFKATFSGSSARSGKYARRRNCKTKQKVNSTQTTQEPQRNIPRIAQCAVFGYNEH
ncbi:MAG TPA: hypothetical protein VFF14_05625, partial [Candidatus Deferrimicrobium sp.]|nr:hypothetical protein [Candidatus Deferrimicrobium sp.]